MVKLNLSNSNCNSFSFFFSQPRKFSFSLGTFENAYMEWTSTRSYLFGLLYGKYIAVWIFVASFLFFLGIACVIHKEWVAQNWCFGLCRYCQIRWPQLMLMLSSISMSAFSKALFQGFPPLWIGKDFLLLPWKSVAEDLAHIILTWLIKLNKAVLSKLPTHT